MTRTAFLAALEQLLAPLPEAERKDALSYYEDYLDAAGPEKEAQAIAELGTPEEVARKILDEQSPQGVSAAPASPAPRSHWRMVLGGGLAVLVLVCFFFQHSKATPVQPVEPVSSASEILRLSCASWSPAIFLSSVRTFILFVYSSICLSKFCKASFEFESSFSHALLSASILARLCFLFERSALVPSNSAQRRHNSVPPHCTISVPAQIFLQWLLSVLSNL